MTITPIPVGRPRDLENYRDRLARGAPEAQRCLDWLDEQRAMVPDLIARAYDGSGGKSPGIPDRTASTATELDRIDRKRIDILDAIAVIGKAVSVFEDALGEARRTRADIPHQTPVEPTKHTERTCIGYTDGPECNDLPNYHFDLAGVIVMHERCGKCEALQEAHEHAKAKHAQYVRQQRIAAKRA